MASTIDQLEREKYELIRQKKELEIAKSNIESDSRRKDDKLNELTASLKEKTLKLNLLREKSKTENKNVLQLIRRFAGVLKTAANRNKDLVNYFTKLLQGLSLQIQHDLPEFSLFDAKAELAGLFDKELADSFVKIEFGKLKAAVLRDFEETPQSKELGRLYESTYLILLDRMKHCQVAAHEMAAMKQNFEAHSSLVKDTNALLRSNNMRGSLDLSTACYADNSCLRSSLLLDESALGNDSFRLPVGKDRRLSVLDDSVVDGEASVLLDETPRKRKTISFDDP